MLARTLPPAVGLGEAHSTAGRLLLVVFTETDARIRIISAERLRRASVVNMKNTRRPRGRREAGMPAEYDLDWSKAKPNPYAARLKDTVAVVLAPDVAEVFPTSESVNTFLRSVITAVPRPARRSTVPPKLLVRRKAKSAPR
jgi:hypothetical protein